MHWTEQLKDVCMSDEDCYPLYTHQMYVVAPRCIHLVLLEIVPPYDDITTFLAIACVEDIFDSSFLSLSIQD